MHEIVNDDYQQDKAQPSDIAKHIEPLKYCVFRKGLSRGQTHLFQAGSFSHQIFLPCQSTQTRPSSKSDVDLDIHMLVKTYSGPRPAVMMLHSYNSYRSHVTSRDQEKPSM